jgi:pimeloyl-ACP methyl ester carboxylesterase
MISTALRRGWRTFTGFPGIGGLGWLCSVLTAPDGDAPETLACADAAAPGTRYLEVDGHPVAVREAGDGAPVVLLHGFGGRIETWRAVQPALAATCRTIAIDLWGFGASGRPPVLAPEDWVRQVFAVMDALEMPEAVFVAHSLGGRVSLMCAKAAPARVRGMVLCDSDWGHAPHGYLLAGLITRSPLFPAAMRRLRHDPRHVARLIRMVYGRDYRMDDATLAFFQQSLHIAGTTRTLASVGQRQSLRGLQALTQGIACPARVIWGADDLVIPPEFAVPLAHRLGAPNPLIIPDCGHFPQEECPEIVVEEINMLLAQMG